MEFSREKIKISAKVILLCQKECFKGEYHGCPIYTPPPSNNLLRTYSTLSSYFIIYTTFFFLKIIVGTNYLISEFICTLHQPFNQPFVPCVPYR